MLGVNSVKLLQHKYSIAADSWRALFHDLYSPAAVPRSVQPCRRSTVCTALPHPTVCTALPPSHGLYSPAAVPFLTMNSFLFQPSLGTSCRQGRTDPSWQALQPAAPTNMLTPFARCSNCSPWRQCSARPVATIRRLCRYCPCYHGAQFYEFFARSTDWRPAVCLSHQRVY